MLFPCLLLTTWISAQPGAADTPTKAPKEVQGSWVAIKAEMGGKAMPEAFCKSLRLTLDGDRYTVQAESLDQGTIAYGKEKDQLTMDITGKSGPNQGKTFPAIYKMEQNHLVICYNLAGKERPTAFLTKPGTQQFLVTYARKKE